jgi:hypothetical protein
LPEREGEGVGEKERETEDGRRKTSRGGIDRDLRVEDSARQRFGCYFHSLSRGRRAGRESVAACCSSAARHTVRGRRARGEAWGRESTPRRGVAVTDGQLFSIKMVFISLMLVRWSSET